jgi:hypothetical protein
MLSIFEHSSVTGLFPSICITSINISQLSELRLQLPFSNEGVCSDCREFSSSRVKKKKRRLISINTVQHTSRVTLWTCGMVSSLALISTIDRTQFVELLKGIIASERYNFQVFFTYPKWVQHATIDWMRTCIQSALLRLSHIFISHVYRCHFSQII